jgi:hypothetical protein
MAAEAWARTKETKLPNLTKIILVFLSYQCSPFSNILTISADVLDINQHVQAEMWETIMQNFIHMRFSINFIC